jgi:hypothetical protein
MERLERLLIEFCDVRPHPDKCQETDSAASVLLFRVTADDRTADRRIRSVRQSEAWVKESVTEDL